MPSQLSFKNPGETSQAEVNKYHPLPVEVISGEPSGVPTFGTLALTTALVRLAPGSTCRTVLVQADPANGTSVNLGDAVSQPIVLSAGQTVTLPITDVSMLWAKMASSTGRVNWVAVI